MGNGVILVCWSQTNSYAHEKVTEIMATVQARMELMRLYSCRK